MAMHPPSATIVSTMQTTGSNIASACIFVPMRPHERLGWAHGLNTDSIWRWFCNARVAGVHWVRAMVHKA